MRTHHLLLLALLLLASFAPAQTRKLAHRSHAGNPNTFAMVMDDDHGGGPVPEKTQEVYYLEPWIIKIRKHYEEVAKQNGNKNEVKTEVKTDPKTGPEKPTEPKNVPQDSLQEKSKQKSKSNAGNAFKSSVPEPEPTAVVTEVPHIRLAKAVVGAPSSASGNLWLLAGLIIACVAPCIILISGGWKRKRLEE